MQKVQIPLAFLGRWNHVVLLWWLLLVSNTLLGPQRVLNPGLPWSKCQNFSLPHSQITQPRFTLRTLEQMKISSFLTLNFNLLEKCRQAMYLNFGKGKGMHLHFGALDQNGVFSHCSQFSTIPAHIYTKTRKKTSDYVLQALRIYLLHLQGQKRQKFKKIKSSAHFLPLKVLLSKFFTPLRQIWHSLTTRGNWRLLFPSLHTSFLKGAEANKSSTRSALIKILERPPHGLYHAVHWFRTPILLSSMTISAPPTTFRQLSLHSLCRPFIHTPPIALNWHHCKTQSQYYPIFPSLVPYCLWWWCSGLCAALPAWTPELSWLEFPVGS